MGGNTCDGRVVSDTTCSKGEGLGEDDGKGEWGSVEASGTNGVDNVDGANMVLGGCIDRRGCWLARPPFRLLPLSLSASNRLHPNCSGWHRWSHGWVWWCRRLMDIMYAMVISNNMQNINNNPMNVA